MPQADGTRSTPRRPWLVDVLVVLVLTLGVVAGYRHLSEPYRAAPGPHHEDAWLEQHVSQGAVERDTRTGEVLAELLETRRGNAGFLLVQARLHVARDDEGRAYFREQLLLPGRRVRLNTTACIVEGKVAHVYPQDE